ncbi:lanthionine synthetase C family protein [Streptomyces sp. NPDC088354]|uniref:lanthionine synthetase C family protein n=1 Tax=Streptomyces sp. NPDC088354 TaxID=3365856 RepID=UPI0037F2E4E2
MTDATTGSNSASNTFADKSLSTSVAHNEIPAMLEIVTEVAERLREPKQVAYIATSPDNTDKLDGIPPHSPWEPLSLAEGFPGIAVLHAELGLNNPASREHAHTYISASAPFLSDHRKVRSGLHIGPAALAFAVHSAVQDENDYANLLKQLDNYVVARSKMLLLSEAERLKTGSLATASSRFDIISGLSGLGRYLLSRTPRHRAQLEEILQYFVRFSSVIQIEDSYVPGWAVNGAPGIHAPENCEGHLAFGMAHGVAGPLALLSIAQLGGVVVQGIAEAATRMADWLVSWQQDDSAGPYWPASITLSEQIKQRLERVPTPLHSWCWGSPGIARTLYLAGKAFDSSQYTRLGMSAFRAALIRDESVNDTPLDDTGLCHGRAGLLHSTQLMVDDTRDPYFENRLHQMAGEIVQQYRPEAPFGFSLPGSSQFAQNRAGFSEGAAGTALAIHSYLRGSSSKNSWNSALLLA